MLHAGGIQCICFICWCEMYFELRMEVEDSYDRYLHSLLLWLAKWGGRVGVGFRDYKLSEARAQSAGLIILALTSQGQVCDTEGQSAEITDVWKEPV